MLSVMAVAGKVAKSSSSKLFAEDYFRIPNFIYEHLGVQVEGKDSEECAALCSRSEFCSSGCVERLMRCV